MFLNRAKRIKSINIVDGFFFFCIKEKTVSISLTATWLFYYVFDIHKVSVFKISSPRVGKFTWNVNRSTNIILRVIRVKTRLRRLQFNNNLYTPIHRTSVLNQMVCNYQLWSAYERYSKEETIIIKYLHEWY